jgi:thiol-disulfide isomerase/thioredoxin
MEQLKGRVVLLNFALLGCPHCINSAQMLTRLHEKFKNRGVAIISIYELRNDGQAAISKFDNRFTIQYPSYTTNDAARSSYHFQGYPYFYLIDKQGNIVQGYEGFYERLEKELTDKINGIR